MEPFLFTFPSRIDKYVFFEHEGEEFMFVLTGRVEWQAGSRKLGLEPGDISKLASNENPLGPSPKAVAAMKEAAEGVHIYPARPRRHLLAQGGVAPVLAPGSPTR